MTSGLFLAKDLTEEPDASNETNYKKQESHYFLRSLNSHHLFRRSQTSG
jgi:hypothetical protein